MPLESNNKDVSFTYRICYKCRSILRKCNECREIYCGKCSGTSIYKICPKCGSEKTEPLQHRTSYT